MKIKVDVTQEHIDNGNPRACCHCALALAFQGAGYEQAGVLLDSVHPYGLFSQNRDVYAELPPEAVAFRRDFDSGRPVQPFSFEIDIPDEAVKSAT